MAAPAAGVGRLEEEALRRKERLKALREKTGRKDKEDAEPKTKQLREGEEEGEKHRELRLRNYVPEDEDLKRRRVPQAKPVAVEEKVREQLEAAKPEPIIEEVGPQERRRQEAGEAGEADPEGHRRADPGEAERPGGQPGLCSGRHQRTRGLRLGLSCCGRKALCRLG
uniref:Coiled-coil domain containing 12 n=1 Tax=Pipistrellus kuhlii TaxID=59472 RepID=A0A7J7R2E6_PIPKU|nr:coiled-coil domain containing 12 [Pipistrellus kuhlii]